MTEFQAERLLRQTEDGSLDPFFTGLYGADAVIRQRERYGRALRAFTQRFGTRECLLISAPGRTELAGNHTDHQHGRVLCAALTLDTLAVVSPRADGIVRLLSEGYGETALSLDRLDPVAAETGTTAALVRGVAAGLAARGLPLSGYDGFLTSLVPAGGGFSSSASFEILIAAIFTALTRTALPPLSAAQIGQRAENVYFGKPCGLMDQCACALGGVALLDFADPAAPAAESIPFDFRAHGWTLCAVDVGSSHADLTADYAAIPREMALVAAAFGQSVLRDVEESAYRARRGALAGTLPPRALQRADHFFAENARVAPMAQALRRGDLESYRRLMLASGESSRTKLQNIVPDSQPEERRLAAALERSAQLLGERGAWRVHGGGFGGSLQALMPAELFETYRAGMDALCGAGACRALTLRRVGAAVYGESE